MTSDDLSHPDTLCVTIEQCPTATGMAWQFLVQDGNHTITMQASQSQLAVDRRPSQKAQFPRPIA
jgi:hypothetical protein